LLDTVVKVNVLLHRMLEAPNKDEGTRASLRIHRRPGPSATQSFPDDINNGLWLADPDKARVFAKELVGMTADVIVPSTNLVTAILQRETPTIPVVFVFVEIRSGTASS